MSKHSPGHTVEKTLHSILVDRLPEIKSELVDMDGDSCSYKVAAFFAAYTKKQIKAGNYDELKKCFRVADELVRLSSTSSRQAIQEVYLFSLLRYLKLDTQARHLLPPYLGRLYKKMLGANS